MFSFDEVDAFLVKRHGTDHVTRVEIVKKAGTEVRYEPSRDGTTSRFTATAVGVMLRPHRPIHRTTVNQWRVRGLTIEQADRIADMLGYYPGNIWGQAWDDALDCCEQLELIAS